MALAFGQPKLALTKRELWCLESGACFSITALHSAKKAISKSAKFFASESTYYCRDYIVDAQRNNQGPYASLRLMRPCEFKEGSPKRPGPLYVHLQSNPTASGPRGPSQSKTDTWLAQAFKQEAGAFQGKATSSKSQNSSAGEVAFTSCSASFRPMPMGQLSEKEKHGHVF